ncbi:hypothetical protein ERUR111494_04875 [Erysipelothrix urinaevulpis]|uniref:hypothetical protein n=1 Tax=Erysipelothrix urinaevulpis TaxID=2683717 RepID=UPI001357602C|nr:hypothetical protein [Erysipelothrix urinaevulpis]
MKKLLTILSVLVLLTACGQKDIMKGYKGLKGPDHQFVSEDYKAVMKKIENKEPGLYYFGFSDCPYCQDLVPVLNETLVELDQKAIYIDVKNSSFQGISKAFQDFEATLPQDKQSGGAFPYVMGIDKDGNVNTHKGTVQSHNLDTGLTEDEAKYIKLKIKQLIGQ